ncbi:MAG: hypothetical protein WC766_00085 [Patescibacteria group bacterium]
MCRTCGGVVVGVVPVGGGVGVTCVGTQDCGHCSDGLSMQALNHAWYSSNCASVTPWHSGSELHLPLKSGSRDRHMLYCAPHALAHAAALATMGCGVEDAVGACALADTARSKIKPAMMM